MNLLSRSKNLLFKSVQAMIWKCSETRKCSRQEFSTPAAETKFDAPCPSVKKEGFLNILDSLFKLTNILQS